jgi:hypothetical protein
MKRRVSRFSIWWDLVARKTILCGWVIKISFSTSKMKVL